MKGCRVGTHGGITHLVLLMFSFLRIEGFVSQSTHTEHLNQIQTPEQLSWLLLDTCCVFRR